MSFSVAIQFIYIHFKITLQWGVSNTKCCFDCYAGNSIYGHPKSKNIVVVRIFNFHQEPFAFWGKPSLFSSDGRFANLCDKQIRRRQKNSFRSQHYPFTSTISAGYWLVPCVAAKTRHYHGNQGLEGQILEKKVSISKFVSVERSWKS